MKKIEIICGTNRPGSNTRRVVDIIANIYRQKKAPFDILDLHDLPAEIFDPSSYAVKPASFKPFADRVVNSAGIVLVSPEYNGGFPGVLKYFIDMLPFPESFEDRPVCFVGLGMGQWGALRPIEQLQHIFGYRNAYIFPYRVFMPAVHKNFNEAGDFVRDDLLKMLDEQATKFIDFVAHFKPIKGC